MKTLRDELNIFAYERLESVLWDNSHQIEDYDKNENTILRNAEIIREHFKGNKELDNIFCDLLDAYCDQSTKSQAAAYKLGLDDGLNFKKALRNI